MKGTELAKITGRPWAELKEEHPELGHHMSEVSEKIIAKCMDKKIDETPQIEPKIEKPIPAPEPIKPAQETPARIAEDESLPFPIEEIRTGIKGCGNKSSMWKYRHLLPENKESMSNG